MKKFLAVVFMLSLLVSASSAQDTVPGDVIVVLRSSSGGASSAAQSFAASQNAQVLDTFDALSNNTGYIFMTIHSDTEDENELLRRVKSYPNVAAASLNRIYTLNLPEVPNDTEYYRLWGMYAIHAPQAWTLSTGSDDVYVAVVDSGVDYNHPDLRDNFSHRYSRNFSGQGKDNYDPSAYYDERGHGTHVSGTISGIGNNSLGVAGVNWRAKIISVRCLDKKGSGSEAEAIAAFNHIADLLAKHPDLKIAAVNFSAGAYESGSPEETSTSDNPLWLALKIISDTNRAVICVAAGNEDNDIGAPTPSTNSDWVKGSYALCASYLGLDNMIAVAAASSGLEKAYFSNYSRKYVDIAAPGMSVYSTVPLNLSNDTGYAVLPRTYPYASYAGTSMATPHAAGAAALLKAVYPQATASQIKAAILGGADGDFLRDDEIGTSAHGLLDLTGAINFMAAVMSDDAAPQISDANPPAGGIGQRYKTEFFASGTQPITWEIDGGLPEGLTFKDGQISGTPKESGTFPFTVTATNDYGESSLVLDLTIAEAAAPVLDASTMSYDVPASSDCIVTLMTSAGTWPMTWSVDSKDFPADFQLEIDSTSGVIAFTAKTAGTFTLPVHVSNDAGQDRGTFTLRVAESESPNILQLADKTLGHAVLGRKYTDVNNTIDATGTRPISWDIQGLPKGLSFDWSNPKGTSTGSTVTISGRPEESGDFTLRVTASNAWGTVSCDVPFVVEDVKPEFGYTVSMFSRLGLRIGSEFYQPFRVDGSAPITFTVSGDLPDGTNIRFEDNTPIFYGKATKPGHYVFTIIAENSCGRNETGGLVEIDVTDPAVITTHFLPDAVKGVSYDFRLSSLKDTVLVWSVSQDLPAGLTLSVSGDISGIPSDAGKFSFDVKAELPGTDYYASKIFTLAVKELPALVTSSLPGGKQNTPYTMTALSADGTAPLTWSVSSGNMPKGLTLAKNGCISGTPTGSGTFLFELTVSNKVGKASKTFTMIIASDIPNEKPESDDEPAAPTNPTTPTTPEISDSQDVLVIPDLPDIPEIPEVQVTQGAARGLSSLTLGEIAEVTADNAMIAAILPEISVNISNTYTSENVSAFANVKISDDVPAGYALRWHAFRQTGTSAVSDFAEFRDSEGQEIFAVPEDKTINVSAWLEAGETYAPVISAVASGDVSSVGASSSGGGCDSGYSWIVLLFPILMVIPVKLRKDR